MRYIPIDCPKGDDCTNPDHLHDPEGRAWEGTEDVEPEPPEEPERDVVVQVPRLSLIDYLS
jgi:hypothetical protein